MLMLPVYYILHLIHNATLNTVTDVWNGLTDLKYTHNGKFYNLKGAGEQL